MFLPKWGLHAEKAAIIHKIEEEDIVNAWLFGYVKEGRNKCWKVIGERTTLILSSSGDFIITLYPNKKKDKDTALIAKTNRLKSKIRKGLNNMHTLDLKHKNIGASAVLVSEAMKRGNLKDLSTEFTKLFAIEISECDYKCGELCAFNKITAKCGVESCPLGNIVQAELTKIAQSL